MKGHVEAVCPSQFSGELDEIPPAIEVENPVAFTLVAVFLDDLQRHVQQADGRGRFGLLAPDVYPVRSVVRLRDVFFGQAFQVGVGQPREGRKKHLSKGDRNEENQTQPVVNKRFCSCLPLQPNSRERKDNARFPLPSHYLFRYLPEA